MIVRPAGPEDVDALVDVQEEGAVLALGHIFPQDRYPFPRDEVAARWRDEIARADVTAYVCTDDEGLVAGFAATRGTELLHFGTRVDTWGSGLAQRFHDAVLANLVADAAGPVDRVWLRVFEQNVRARRFYERLGWRATGRRTRTSFAPHPVLTEYERPTPL